MGYKDGQGCALALEKGILGCRKDDPQRPLAAVHRATEGTGQAVKPVEHLL